MGSLAEAQLKLSDLGVDRGRDLGYYNKGEINKPPSSRGLGHLPFTEVTGIRIPLGVLKKSKEFWVYKAVLNQLFNTAKFIIRSAYQIFP